MMLVIIMIFVIHLVPYHIYDKNLPENHEIIREIRSIIDEYDERLLIGETFIDNRLYDSLIFHGVNNDELHLPLTFEFPLSPWYPGYIQREIEKKEYLTPEGGWPVYFLNNHDLPRHLSRWARNVVYVWIPSRSRKPQPPFY